MSIFLTKIEFTFSIHSTEDFDKNMEATANLIPENLIENTEVSIEELEGGYDNPIEYVTITFSKNKDMELILRHLSSILTTDQKNQLDGEFDERFNFDNKTFFFRIDKEKIFNNIVEIGSSDNIVKIAIKMRAYIKDVDFKAFLKSKHVL